MSKTFDFRVWDDENDEFLYFDLFNAQDLVNLEAIDSRDIEQYTGIRDRNNKMIFEGDILLEIKTGKSYKVVWWGCRAGYEMEEIPPKDADPYDKMHPGTMYFANKTFGRFEVVGNIH